MSPIEDDPEQKKGFVHALKLNTIIAAQILLTLCRIICLFNVYAHYDKIQTLFVVWLGHSCFIKTHNQFQKVTLWLYCPLFITTYTFYYVINIEGYVN